MRAELAGMTLDNYKVVLYRNQPDGWVAEVRAIPGCYALMATREEALAELEGVFQMIAAEYVGNLYTQPRRRSGPIPRLGQRPAWCGDCADSIAE